MSDVTPGIDQRPWLPPRWFIRLAWLAHRAVYRLTGGRRGLSVPKDDAFGHMRLRTVGRRSGQERVAMLGYFHDGPDLVTLAMNGWGDPEPGWWLNLLANPDAMVDLKVGSRPVRARAAVGEERSRLWATFNAYKGWGTDISAFARRRSRETAVVVLEPRP
jgi:deazaflavin-dependent oxidoreductase (nitroreductase family)